MLVIALNDKERELKKKRIILELKLSYVSFRLKLFRARLFTGQLKHYFWGLEGKTMFTYKDKGRWLL